MKSFGSGPRPFSSRGALAGAIAACILMEGLEGQLEANTLAQSAPATLQPTQNPSTAPAPDVQRGGFGSVAFSAAELNEGIAAGVFICLIGTLFWWESRPPRPKKRAGS